MVGVLGALARGAGAAGFGANRRSTGLAGSPVPKNFSRASDAKGFCGEQSVRRASWVMSVCSQEPHVGPREAEGAPGSVRCSDALGQHSTHGGPGSPLGGRVSGWDSGAAAGVPWPAGSSPGPAESWGERVGPGLGPLAGHPSPQALTSSTACLWMKACCRANVEASRPGTGVTGSGGRDPEMREVGVGIPYPAHPVSSPRKPEAASVLGLKLP